MFSIAYRLLVLNDKGLAITILYTYLIDRAGPFIVVDMTKEGNVNLVLLPELLKVISSHGLSKRPFIRVRFIRGITEYTMSQEDQPGLFLSINCRQAVFNELILLRAFSPV